MNTDNDMHPMFISQHYKQMLKEEQELGEERIQKKNYSGGCKIFKRHLDDLKHAIKLMQEFKNKRVLDLGCSDGQVMELLKENGFKNVCGLDISPEAIERALSKGLNARTGNALCTPFEDNFFDCILASHIVEHVFDSERFFNECKRILKPNGNLIIITENLNSLKERFLFLFGKTPTCLADENHARVFNKRALELALNKSGFEILSIEGHEIGFPVIGHCFFSNRFDGLLSVSLLERMILKTVVKKPLR